jgi:hypothetical protein
MRQVSYEELYQLTFTVKKVLTSGPGVGRPGRELTGREPVGAPGAGRGTARADDEVLVHDLKGAT